MAHFNLTHPEDLYPVHLTPADVAQFRSLMQEECGELLTEQEAWDRAIELINLVRMLMGPIPEDPEYGSSKIVQPLFSKESPLP